MKIENAQIQLSSSRTYEKKQTVEENLQAWVGERPSSAQRPILIDISKDALDLLLDSPEASANSAVDSIHEDDETLSSEDKLKIRLLEFFLSSVTGKKVKLQLPRIDLKHPDRGSYSPVKHQAPAAASVGWGITYDRRESLSEHERTKFAAKGVVTTADGREIKFDISMKMERSYTEESTISLKAGDALKDPLVLNFSGNAAGLSSQTFSFDLDNDGTTDQVSLLKSGSGFLALDTNENGLIDNGSELFGPKTDSGFAELRTFDADANGWIDENDPIFNKLRIWQKDDSGNDKLLALGEAGVGAIYLGHVSTEFTLRQLEVQGKIKESGIFLKENGQAGTIQELDFKI